MVVADERDRRRQVGLPVLRKTFEVLEDRVNAGCREERYRILGVLVEVCVEDALILEVGFSSDVEELPAKIVSREHRETVRPLGHRSLDRPGMRVDGRPVAGDPLRDECETIIRVSRGKDRPVPTLCEFDVSLLRDRHGGGFRPVVLDGYV